MDYAEKLALLEDTRERLYLIFETALPPNRFDSLAWLRGVVHEIQNAELADRQMDLFKAELKATTQTERILETAYPGTTELLLVAFDLLAASVRLEREIRRGNVVPLNVARWR